MCIRDRERTDRLYFILCTDLHQNEKLIILLPGNKIILFLTITIVSKSLNKFSSTLLLLKRKKLQVNYPLPCLLYTSCNT